MLDYDTIIFAIAHEIGHIVSGHIGVLQTIFLGKDAPGKQEQEKQADAFASYVLNTYKTFIAPLYKNKTILVLQHQDD